ncbi:MAG TPA: MotA/TolQ/ExbB proton channel family protein [bacterium]|nr:MotA/TolQ/ExbB proton channel family protein [bacterium]
MKHIHLAIIVFMIIFVSVVCADNIDDAIIKTDNELIKAKNKNSALIDKFAAERKDYASRLNKLRARINELKTELSELTAENSSKERFFNDLEKDVSLKNYEAGKVKKNLKSGAESLLTEFQNTVIAAETSVLTGEIEALVKNKRYPDEDYLRKFFESCLRDIEKSEEISFYNSEIFDKSGTKQNVKIARFGKLGLFYKNNSGAVGFAGYSSASGYLYDIPFSYGWKINSDLKEVFEIENNNSSSVPMPVDLTGGKLIEQFKSQKTVFESIKSGGLIMMPILLIGAAGFAIIIYKYIFLRNQIKHSIEERRKIVSLIENENFDKAIEYCGGRKNFISGIYYEGIKLRTSGKEAVENSMKEKIEAGLPQIEKYMSTLNIFAAIAPLLGLLGTVTGMISTFDAITVFGSGNPKLMSSGISEALITTEYGLIVAIPILFFASLLSDKIEELINVIENEATIFADIISNKRDKG